MIGPKQLTMVHLFCAQMEFITIISVAAASTLCGCCILAVLAKRHYERKDETMTENELNKVVERVSEEEEGR